MRSPRQKNGGMEVHYYMRVTQNCEKGTQLEDYGMLRLSHDHRVILNQTTNSYGTDGDYRTFKLEPKPVVLDVWWPQHMYLVIHPNSIQCSQQIHYRIVSIQTRSALPSDNCSFEVLIHIVLANTYYIIVRIYIYLNFTFRSLNNIIVFQLNDMNNLHFFQYLSSN